MSRERKSLAAGSINTAIYTSPHATADLDPLPALLAMVNGAKTSILFSVYAFTLPTLAAAIMARKASGVAVRAVGDATEYLAANCQFPAMYAAGLDLRLWGNQYRLNHEKVFIVDGSSVALGSYNFTGQAESENKEVLLILTGKQVAKVLAPTLTAQIEATFAAGTVPPATGKPTIIWPDSLKPKESKRPPTHLHVGGGKTGINFSETRY